MDVDKNIQDFLSLVRAGLWNINEFNDKSNIEWKKVRHIAEQQCVLGLVMSGIELLPCELRPPKDELYKWISRVQMIEQKNYAMNMFVASLFDKMAQNGIKSILVKGQGVAQCYNKPLWRSCGDVDLFLDDDEYKKASRYFSTFATKVAEENPRKRHLAMIIDGWDVELHGTLRTGLWRKLDKNIDELQKELFNKNQIRIWDDHGISVNLPSPQNDVLFVFTHILQHFYREGVGLRQICDWCRLLCVYRKDINFEQLYTRLCSMGIMTEWKVFGCLAVEFLGIPKDTMPFYECRDSLRRKAKKVLSFIFETGNFGLKRDYTFYKKYPKLVYKLISLWRHFKDTLTYMSIFPLDSVKAHFSRVYIGLLLYTKK